ncbi:uncharacterized protein LOC111397850 [Olea europaea var. sylvestris]|uniref:uncharacterized protein LOC111397850 n=1 Tax=Olea europaea var. sylvestris TaxID=158386 RepID=UPI000C1CF38B|nr:uncharacterized protein LOC111397850 [Olea europaea var. sylvestris]
MPWDVLCLYLAVSPRPISAVLVKEFPKAQKPVYYVSQVLKGPEIRYSLAEQLVLALIIAVRKLRPCFQSHTVQVMTDQPIKQILHRLETSERLLKWVIEMSEFDIEFKPRTAIKAQALADFITELTTPAESPEGQKTDWKVFVDGSSITERSGARIIMIGPDSEELEYSLCFEFLATNNDAEYEAVITGLGLAARLGVSSIEVCNDLQLIVGQVSREYEAKDGKMTAYLMKVRDLEKGFASFRMTKVPRKENERADALAKLASANPRNLSRTVNVQVLQQPSIQRWVEVKNIEYGESWMDPLIKYLTKNKTPEDPFEAKRMLFEVHAGTCGNHQGATSLAFKILRQGYYWPTMKRDAKELVRKCDTCQRHENLIHVPVKQQVTIFGVCPFFQWGMDILGPLPLAKGQRKFLLVTIDYFTKWEEAEPLATFTTANVHGFVWKNIICRFGIPRVMVTDNGRQFDNHSFKAFCANYHIDHRLTSVAHPQSNGQAEVTNRVILWDLKTRLERKRRFGQVSFPMCCGCTTQLHESQSGRRHSD